MANGSTIYNSLIVNDNSATWTLNAYDGTGIGVGYIPMLTPSSTVLGSFGVIDAGSIVQKGQTGDSSTTFMLADDTVGPGGKNVSMEYFWSGANDYLCVDTSLQIYDVDDVSRAINFTIGNNDITTSPYSRLYGYLTAVTGAEYTQLQINDTDDYLHLTRSTSDILGLSLDMPLVMADNPITVSSHIFSMTCAPLAVGGTDYTYNTTSGLNDGATYLYDKATIALYGFATADEPYLIAGATGLEDWGVACISVDPGGGNVYITMYFKNSDFVGGTNPSPGTSDNDYIDTWLFSSIGFPTTCELFTKSIWVANGVSSNYTWNATTETLVGGYTSPPTFETTSVTIFNTNMTSGEVEANIFNADTRYECDGVVVIKAEASKNNVFFGSGGNTSSTGINNITLGSNNITALGEASNNLCIGANAGGSLTTTYNVDSAVFSGSGLNDATSGGTYTGTGYDLYEIDIDSTGTPDTFKWNVNGGAFTTGVAITGSAQTLSNGVTITFAATTGHTLNDQWKISGYRSSGDWNTLIGANAGSSMTTAFGNVSIGKQGMNDALTANNNIGIGDGHLYNNESGSNNIGFGSYVLGEGTSIQSNIAIGDHAGYKITGNRNICIGAYSGYNADTNDELFIDGANSTQRASAALDRAGALIYGVFNSTASLQSLTINGKLTTSYGRVCKTTRVTTTYQILTTDEIVYADSDGGAYTVTLPAGSEGQHIKVINCGSAGNNITLEGSGSEQVMSENNQTLYDGDVIDLHYNTTEGWW